jgi:hypothetical protein
VPGTPDFRESARPEDMFMRIRQLTASTMVGAAALLLTGCGGSPLDGAGCS